MPTRSAIVCLLLASFPAQLSAQEGGPEAAAQAKLMLQRRNLGLDERTAFRLQGLQTDETGARHVRLQQLFRGLKVWGGQVITHTDAQGRESPMTNALVPDIQVDTSPNLTPAEALAVAHQGLSPTGTYAAPPTAELLIFPSSTLQPLAGAEDRTNARNYFAQVTEKRLAYQIHMELENGPEETRHDDFLVDAQTGAILKTWSTLFTVTAKGKAVTTTGNSQYSGEVQLGSLAMDCGYILSDPTRNNISTRDMRGGTSGSGVLYVNPSPVWGDGQNYQTGQGSASVNGQTAAVDAHYGLQTTWDFYKNILGRNGIDGKGTTATNRVHFARGFDNAFWKDDCFCMVYGDGLTFNTLTALDVVGHEVSHGLCHTSADLGYLGESGALNEANSDIFGVMINFYSKGAKGKGKKVPELKGPWTIGEDLKTAAYPHPLRYLYKPSLDGFSPDAWSPDLEFMDVHHGSGPMNRAFYFLSQGASPLKGKDTYSKYLPKGMAGIGNDKAMRIWWLTLSTRLTPASRYVDARKGAIHSAGTLFGYQSKEVAAVRAAFKAINVGEAYPHPEPVHPSTGAWRPLAVLENE